jgi:hypothetical protein
MKREQVRIGSIILQHYEGSVWINKKTGDYYITDMFPSGRRTFLMYDPYKHGEISKYLLTCEP